MCIQDWAGEMVPQLRAHNCFPSRPEFDSPNTNAGSITATCNFSSMGQLMSLAFLGSCTLSVTHMHRIFWDVGGTQVIDITDRK